MERPKLSIITINYNDSNGLLKTMNSVFDQTFKDFQYILIDGGSEDGSVELIKQNQDRISYWVSEKDQGVFYAQNKGIEASKGEYLLFLNSGDVLNGNSALEEFLGHIDFAGDIIYGDYKFEEGEKIYPDDLTPYFFMKSSLPHQSTLFKRTVFEEIGHYNVKYKLGADRAFYIKCFMDGSYKFQHIEQQLTIYDLTGLSNDPSKLEEKQKEDEMIYKEGFGEKYEELCEMRAAEKKQYLARRNSLKGILKRIKKRLSL